MPGTPGTPTIADNVDSDCSNSNMDTDLSSNLISNFRMTLQNLDLQFTNICTEYSKVIRENVDLKRQVERLEGSWLTFYLLIYFVQLGTYKGIFGRNFLVFA